MRAHEFINEAPISDFQVFGNFSGNKEHNDIFYHPDEKLLHSEKAIKKIYNAFSKTPFEFNFYVLMPTITKTSSPNDLVLGKPSYLLNYIQNELGHKIETDRRITVIYTNNVVGKNPMPMTAWTFAHRIGHAIQNPEKENIPLNLKQYEEDIMNDFLACCNTILGTSHHAKSSHLGVEISGHVYNNKLHDLGSRLLSTRSGRTNTLNNIHIELFCELIAQYLISGKVKLNRISPEYNDIIEKTEAVLNEKIFNMFSNLVGKVLSF
jgi:hypothetical protein